MGISIYFGESREALVGGFGFTKAGLWRALPLPEGAAGLIVDDRFLPDRRGLAAARQALRGGKELLIFDFERPPSPLPAELVRSLAGARVAVPPAWAELPHEAVLIGPRPGTVPFSRWLEEQQARYGPVILDGLPLRTAAAPGEPWEPWTGPLPETGFPCPGLRCLHRRRADGKILFWDTRKTLTERIKAFGVPVIVFSEDWESLPP